MFILISSCTGSLDLVRGWHPATNSLFSICLDWAYFLRVYVFSVFLFFFFFFFFSFFLMHAFQLLRDKVHCSCTVHGTHNHFIQEKNIKTGSHGTIYIFKNYFAIVFSVFSKISCIQMDPNHSFWFISFYFSFSLSILLTLISNLSLFLTYIVQ